MYCHESPQQFAATIAVAIQSGTKATQLVPEQSAQRAAQQLNHIKKYPQDAKPPPEKPRSVNKVSNQIKVMQPVFLRSDISSATIL